MVATMMLQSPAQVTATATRWDSVLVDVRLNSGRFATARFSKDIINSLRDTRPNMGFIMLGRSSGS